MHKLYYLQKKFSQLPLQGSTNWLEGRKYAFGGSEMDAVLHDEKQKKLKKDKPKTTLKDILQNKISQDFIVCDATEWGHMFEPVAKILVEKDLQTTIYEFGSVPHCFYPICYSPDGLIVKDNDLHLLEIKCPIWRGVNSIPTGYVTQVQTGMNVFPVNGCYFYQFRFRRCALWTKNITEDYDRMWHKESYKRAPKQTPSICGYLIWEKDCDLIDLGMVECIHETLKKYGCDSKYTKLQIGGFFNHKKGLVLKWKLFNHSLEYIKPIDNFLKNQEKDIWEKYKLIHQQNTTLQITEVKIPIL
jgi:hypothetical protein